MRFAVAAMIVAALAAAARAETPVLEDFEKEAPAVVATQSVEGSVAWTIEKGPDGRYLKVDFTRGKEAGYAYVNLPVVDALVKNAAAWDGVAFRVKGDGSKTFGLIEVRADDYARIYHAIFPLRSTEWTEVAIRWDEFFQMDDDATDTPINWATLNRFSLGSRAGWGSASYAVDDFALAKITPREPAKAPEGFARLAGTVEKLKAGKPVKIVALGDSITYGAKVPRDEQPGALYFNVAADTLRKAFPLAQITTVNAGIGGDTVAEGLVRVGHYVAAEEPDLVLVLLGANDAIGRFPETRVRRTMGYLIDALLSTTSAEVLILGPTPILDAPGVPESYGEMYADLAREKGVAALELTPAISILAAEDMKRAYGDNVHLSSYGHSVIGKAVGEHIIELAK